AFSPDFGIYFFQSFQKKVDRTANIRDFRWRQAPLAPSLPVSERREIDEHVESEDELFDFSEHVGA
ncbi:hypothetical protein BX616_001619, partial [Lobosporangium transversale]